jgi:WD40 repeat protein
VELWQVATGKQKQVLHQAGMPLLFLSERTLLTLRQGTLHLWPLPRGKPRLLPEVGLVTQVALSRDGAWLAVVVLGPISGWALWHQGSAKAWEQAWFYSSPEGHATAAAFSPQGNLLAVGTSQGKVLLGQPSAEGWDTLYTLECGALVRDVAFSPDGATLAVGLSNGTIRLWEVGP